MKVNRLGLKARLRVRLDQIEQEDAEIARLRDAYDSVSSMYQTHCAVAAQSFGRVIECTFPFRPYRSSEPDHVQLNVTYMVDKKHMPTEPEMVPSGAEWQEREAIKTLLNILNLSNEENVTLSAQMTKQLAHITLSDPF